MTNKDLRRGMALPVVLMLLLVSMSTMTFLLMRARDDLKLSSMNKRLKTSSALANNVATDLLRQFSQNYQENHYDEEYLYRSPAFYNQGFSSVTLTANATQHFIAFEAVGSYGSDLENPMNKKTISGVIKFISDLTTFGTMVNGSFTTSGTATYMGKTWINGNWRITAAGCLVNGGPAFVNGNISTGGAGTLTINGDLYRAGSRTGNVTVAGTDNAFMPQMTWPTIDRTYFDTYYNVKVTANTNVRFRYTAGSSTGTVSVGTNTYVIPPSGFIIYGQNCTITSSGTLRGRVTIASIRTSGASGGNITIDNNLTYATTGSTVSANINDSFAAIASNAIAWNKPASPAADMYVVGAYFVDSTGTTGITSSGPSGRTFRLFGTRNKGNSGSGFSSYLYTFDTNLDTYPPPGLPEKPYLVTWRIK